LAPKGGQENKMKQSLLKKWLTSLRSGEFEQGQCALNKDGKYCCLGVLCEISGIGEWYPLNGYQLYRLNDRAYCGYIPPQLGLDDINVAKLIGMNDHQKKNFAEIADYIEQNVVANDAL
jgi:hypothetical protein